MGYSVPKGIYYFDTFDTDGGSCFIAKKLTDIPKKAHKKLSAFCYNVELTDIRKANAT